MMLNIIEEIQNLIKHTKEENNVYNILSALGIELNNYFVNDLIMDYENLIWNLIQDYREMPETCDAEYEYFCELIYKSTLDNSEWTAEKIFNFFTNTDLIEEHYITN